MDSTTETLEQVQARHRREAKDLQGRITSKKKNSTKKTRKGVNDECAELERQMRERHAQEIAAVNGETNGDAHELDNNEDELRMARRAAEQEAAAIQAEEEAANMTDYRAKESEYMKKTFETNGLVEKDIMPDGHCLFAAIADQLSQNSIPLGDSGSGGAEPPYKTVRRAAATYMLEHGDDFAPFLEEPLESYTHKMGNTAEWGGQLELMALARQYNVGIRVVQDGGIEPITGRDGEVPDKTLWLAYYRHGYGLGEHYNSLRKAP
ncbi:hypothetical protein BGZ63DRAFT_354723 [Mariannaea sp. PMI_226]|nr:hypothetical protein BGZ63DRAFT_354723 [Mariannaea sp. PMI_226]